MTNKQPYNDKYPRQAAGYHVNIYFNLREHALLDPRLGMPVEMQTLANIYLANSTERKVFCLHIHN